MLGPEFEQIARCIPNDDARVSSAEQMLAEAARRVDGPLRVLDLGCGDGRGLDLVTSTMPQADYCGVDIEGSPEVTQRSKQDARFHSYNGTDLPFADAAFDIVYSRQVFEHVRHPDKVVAEIRRVLKPGGMFVGSMSNLEPYHSYSIFNYTPYGVFRIMEDNGLDLMEMRPGMEGMALIMRRITSLRIKNFSLYYPLVEAKGRLNNWDARKRNYLKLRLSGHICFLARRPLEN
ncbi:class I SAM-dependent methyltransferase [Altererythrobacter sp. KTW20L]|uniref:class I SAM-dependent methyltransferase n=1 Tax=Altererythrobacter sp. KTW20L TaxID=2942210 RepID=UPI0020BD56A9|nr:class I SAM-dependent methyltransferase [Altererythrobacter sp. KTW20L]MCL6250010.1 class I SAM-dependent methyltransferase [Altererythrobacter sp. KTW20L]